MLDLGNLTIGLELDERPFDRSMTNVEKRADNLEKKLSGAKKIDVAPTGTRELDNASKSADGLKRGLDQAAASSGKVKAPTGLDASLAKSAGSADNLASSLDQAAREASELGGSAGGVDQVSTALGGAVNIAKNLVPALSAAATATTVFTKGWDRLTSIDNAQFKLQGLGHTAESTASIMNSAMDSVSGTAYGFGDAASLAAGTVAATGAQGERLTEILTTIADVSAISGRELGDIGLIFNQIAASGVIQAEELNQLMDSGIPVLQMLGDEIGVTAGEVKDLASEGEISFEQFEAAMRTGMGGAAKEMGASVTGALSNVGAALGRLGAETMSGGFSMLPDVLTGVTSGIDTLTEGVSTLSGWLGGIPEPVKALASALLLAKGASVALNSELGQNMVKHLKSAGDGALGMGGNVVQAFRDMGDAYRTSSAPLLEVADNHRNLADVAYRSSITTSDSWDAVHEAGRSTAHRVGQHASTIGGHFRGIGGAAKSGVDSVVNALGGPLNIALAGATFAVGKLIEGNRQASEVQEAMAESTRLSAEAQTELYDAVMGTTGALNEQGLAAAARLASAELTELVDVGGKYQSWLNVVEAPDLSWYEQGFWNEEFNEYRAEINRLSDDYQALETVAQDMGYSVDDVNQIVAEGGPAYTTLIAGLEGSGEAGQRAAADLEAARAKIVEVQQAAQDVDPAFRDAADAVDLIAESAGDADKMLGGMVDALRVMGLMPEDATEAMMELGGAIRDVVDATAEVADADNGALGAGLFGEDGNLDHMNENAAELAEHVSTLAGEYRGAVSAGNDAHTAFADMAPAIEGLATAYGLTTGEVEELLRNLGVAPDVVTTLYNLEGASEAVQSLGDVYTAMYPLEEGATLQVDALTDGAVGMLESLGYEVRELDNGNFEITVGTAEAYNNLGELINQAGVFEGMLYTLTEDPHTVQVHMSQVTEETKAELEAIGVQVSGPNMTGQVDLTFPEGSAIMDTLSEIGIMLGTTLDGEIQVHAADVDAAKARLDELKIAAEIIDGRLIIDSNDESVRQRMVDLGWLVADPMTGEVVINENIALHEDNVTRLYNTVMGGASGSAVITDNSADVAANIRNNLVKTTYSDHQINVIAQAVGDSARVAAMAGISLPVGWTGGRFGGAGFRLPGYAAGDRHAGYRLPGTGPGTDMTDGFMALDHAGMPVARLDADEWVINGDASETFDPVLAAINANQPSLAMAALMSVMNSLPGYAEGGNGPSSATQSGGDLPNVEMSADAEVSLNAVGVSDELAIIGQQLEEVGQGETVTVEAVSDEAMAALESVGLQTTELPDGSVEVTTHTDQSLDALATVSDGLHELGDTEINPQVLFDTTEIEVNAEQAQELLDALAIEEPTPTAQLIIDDLVAGKGIAVGELEFLHSMSPTPAADINTALLEAGVALSEAELQRVGNSKATSVVDVNNQSALQNVNATLAALDTMPVERVIRIVAAGSAASAISNRQYGGQIPRNATGGRLPTSGPGTHTTDGILGVDGDGVPTSWVDRGEWVVNRGRSERFNKTLNAINGGSVNEIVAAIRADIPNMQALAEGGVVSPEQLLDFAAGQIVNGEQASRSLQGAPYVWGGVNWGDCSGAMSGLANFAKGLAPFASRFATGNQREALAAMGFVAGLGDPSTSFNLGWFNGGPWGGHTAGDIGGTAVEMGGGAGGQGKIGGAAASASSSQFTDHAHLTLGELWAFDYFNRTGPHGFTYQPAPDPSWQTEGGRGMSPGGEGLAVVNGLGGGVSHTGGDGIHLNNGMVIPFNNGRMYDTGGLWPKGTWGFNNIGDELVLPPRETEQFQALPDAAEAMYMVAAELSALHPEVAKAVDELLPLAEQGLVALDEGVKFMEAAADPNSVEGLTARGTARGVLGWDILPYTEQLTSIMDAEQELTESRADYEARTVAITDAQDELAQAKQELHELETASTDMSVQDARKLADAQKAVDEAKADAAQASGDKQAAAAEKVADSEEKLRRVREDIAAGAEEDAIKRAEDIAKATDQVAEAEVNLTEKRMDAVAALDHIDVGDYLRGLVPGINGAIGALNGLQGSVGSLGGVIPQLTGVLGQAATMAGTASMPLGVAIQMVSTGIDVARQVYEIFETIIDGASEAKAEVASMAATGASSMREWSQAVDAQRQTVAQLSISVRQLQMDVQRAAWDSAQAARDVGRAQLDASVQVAQAQARLAEERRTQQEEWDAQARANYWSNEDLSLSYDRLRWAQEESIDGVLDTQREATPEMIALQNEIYAAQYAAAVSVLDAEIAALNASYALAEAQKALARGQDELTKAVQRFNAMQNSAYGFSTPEAMTGEEIARLRAENARLQGEINNPGNRIGNFLDFDGDGKVFWLLDNAGSQVTQSAQAMIDANNRRIAELESSQYAPQYSDDQRAEMDRAMEWASNAWARGDEDTAQIIMDSAFGEWTRALEDQAFNQQIWDWEDSWTDIQQMAEDMDAAEQHQKDMLALEQKRDQLQAGANANQYYAEGSRAESAELREAYKALADYEAARATASTSPKNVTINGNHFNAEQMANAITSLYDGQGNLNVRLNALEAPDRITGRDLMAAKRR